MFAQASEGRPPEPGTGLGLPLCRRLLALMGSQLELESALGADSRFHFTLELASAIAPTAATAVPRRIIGHAGPPRRVLIVDDVAANRALLRDLLQPLGFVIAESANGADTLALAARNPPDLVLLDLRLPDVDGLTVARQLRSLYGAARLRIVAVSASALTIDRAAVTGAGCDDFLPKPFRESDLIAKLGALLDLEWIEQAPPPAATASPTLQQVSTQSLREPLAYAREGQIVPLRTAMEDLAATSTDPVLGEITKLVRAFQLERLSRLLETTIAGRGEA